jgi:mRNA interferase RelE/StbE
LAYRIEIQRSAEKELAALASTLQARIIKAIDGLAAEARRNGCRKLSEAKNVYRIRAGKYRILYEIYDEILVVIVIGSRIGARSIEIKLKSQLGDRV